jgi:hypothetical protein
LRGSFLLIQSRFKGKAFSLPRLVACLTPFCLPSIDESHELS